MFNGKDTSNPCISSSCVYFRLSQAFQVRHFILIFIFPMKSFMNNMLAKQYATSAGIYLTSQVKPTEAVLKLPYADPSNSNSTHNSTHITDINFLVLMGYNYKTQLSISSPFCIRLFRNPCLSSCFSNSWPSSKTSGYIDTISTLVKSRC